MKKLVLLIGSFLIFGCNTTQVTAPQKPMATTAPAAPAKPQAPAMPAKPVKNIILMIGDGMGLTQTTAGMYANGNKTELEKFEYIGLHKSHASDNLITDSAAAATAFACGIKTYNGAIAVDDNKAPIPTILEEAEEKGLATGLVSTSTIVHATPASFIAHNESRRNYEAIAADFLKTDIDLFIGGGRKFFERREDERNLTAELNGKGYVVKDFVNSDLLNLDIDPTKNFACYTSDDQPLPVAQGRNYLPAVTKQSIEYLDAKAGDNGFFLMVEGSQIDWGGHANKADYIISEFIDFDLALKEAVDFAEKDGNTLVVVTADHETGGFAIQTTSTMDSLVTAFTSDYHTATMIPVYALGPRADDFKGIYENIAIYDKMRAAYGWKNKFNSNK